MKRSLILLGLCGALCAGRAAPNGIPPSAGSPSGTAPADEDLFKWGEYDSLIRMLDPAARGGSLAEPRSGADSMARAKSFLFLGVAFYATGKPQSADDAFRKACDLDSGVKLDRFYVTEEIADHFQAIASEGMRRRSRKPVQASGAAVPSLPPYAGAAHRARMEASRGRSWLWWGLGVTAAAVAGGGAYYFASRDGGSSDHVTIIDLKQ